MGAASSALELARAVTTGAGAGTGRQEEMGASEHVALESERETIT